MELSKGSFASHPRHGSLIACRGSAVGSFFLYQFIGIQLGAF